MRNFLKLASGVDVGALLHAIQIQPELWNQYTLRTKHPGTVHSQVDDIWLRFNPVGGEKDKAVIDEHESLCYPAWYALPQARSIIFDLMRRVEGIRLGRVLITRLAPGKKIDAHVDGGSPATYYERYHTCLQNFPGSNFRADEEQICMNPGEVWWFDNKAEHEVINNSVDDRIVMITDIQVSKHADLPS